MYRFAKRALISACLVAAIAAPLSGMAATSVVRDARQNTCKLVSAPFAAHKTPYRTSQYVCGGVTYAVSDPRLSQAVVDARVQADGRPGRLVAR
ncbi:hypothetical protein [Caulobacter sp. UNC279MFTsu5.1]|uniref:hypothetical protein n=1 Tax=Caulobacter sp. UNC279MFTsu5.1 TaxID=1502775 RepID=UPI0008EC87B4|nr:hypothetical protein [Caulobacter sp. UNC279MFTsu5.1]SFI53678.1 hypothetical protein SAMN02799626_00066 [Caulobacter sp. UNC279MFTsu5.1]